MTLTCWVSSPLRTLIQNQRGDLVRPLGIHKPPSLNLSQPLPSVAIAILTIAPGEAFSQNSLLADGIVLKTEWIIGMDVAEF